MTKRDSFFELIKPEHLYDVALFFGAVTIVLVLAIYIHLFFKKRRYFKNREITGSLDEWIGEAIIAEPEEPIVVSDDLIRKFKKYHNRQLAIERLIDTKKNLTGTSADNIVRLYEQLGLQKDSLNKFRSTVWYNKAKGIYELYMMSQVAYKDSIARFTNAGNEYVRMEAQIAILGFDGFAGLRFLDGLTYSLHEWQQLKLIEQLSVVGSPGDIEHLPQWLSSPNDYVIHFALRLTDIYQQLQVHDEVAACLKSNNEKIRYQAIKTLGRIANTETVSLLKEQYFKETPANQRKILKQMKFLADADDNIFLMKAIEDGDDVIKVEAIRALSNCCPMDWMKLLGTEDETILSIVKQVKQEMAI